MNWYRRSLNDHDTHRGHLRRGRVMAVCGIEFSPVPLWRKGGAALRGELPEPEQVCLEGSDAPIDVKPLTARLGVGR